MSMGVKRGLINNILSTLSCLRDANMESSTAIVNTLNSTELCKMCMWCVRVDGESNNSMCESFGVSVIGKDVD